MDQLSAGTHQRITSVLAFALAAYALYWAVGYVEAHTYRISFLLLTLVITFLAGTADSEGRCRRTGRWTSPTFR